MGGAAVLLQQGQEVECGTSRSALVFEVIDPQEQTCRSDM